MHVYCDFLIYSVHDEVMLIGTWPDILLALNSFDCFLQHRSHINIKRATPGIQRHGIPARMNMTPLIQSGYVTSASAGKPNCGEKIQKYP